MKKVLASLFVFFICLFIKIDSVWARTPPASQDPDINIRIRGWVPAAFLGDLIDYGIEVADSRAPQLDTIFGDSPVFTEFSKVRDYNGGGIDASNTTTPGIARVQASPGTQVLAPEIGYDIGGGFNYVILHASDNDIVIKATLEDNMIAGYGLHFMDINVNPELKALYDENEANGRTQLVAIPCRAVLGTVGDQDPLVVIRDTGSFMDIRSQDWWKWDSPGCSGQPPGLIDSVSNNFPPFDPSVKIACNAWHEPEYHSLRPYPASPTCNPNVTQTTTLCGNDLIASETFEVRPSDAQSCSGPDADGNRTCHFVINSRTQLAVDLSTADLPIVGNTELVPNSQSSGGTLNFAQRMSNYVSWYLNGTVQRAEERYFTVPTDATQLVTFAGPLRKLLPQSLQTLTRLGQINNSQETRHNQIVGCSPNSPQPCYSQSTDYVRLETVGTNPDRPLFPYIPYSSTEDRVGTADGPEVIGRGEVSTTINSFVPVQSTLYFAHMQENSELSTLLQGTYLPQGSKPDTISATDIEQIQRNPGCVPIETRNNSGDNLYAEPITQSDNTIGGLLDYTTEFDCTFPPPRVDNACVLQCVEEGGLVDECADQCFTPTPACVKSAVNVMSFSTQTPLADDIWAKLVGGTMSVFRRMFPKVSPGSPVEKVKDIPGETKVMYSSTNVGASIPVVAQETNAGEGRSGSDASLYFPHLGGISDYFLNGVQRALLPQGMGPLSPSIGGDPGPNPPLGTPIDCSPDALRPAFGDQANAASCVADAESSCIPNNYNTSCLRIGGTQDYSFGLFGINLLAHPANDYLVPPDLQILFDNLAVSEGRSPGYYWTCKQAFNTIGSASSKCENCYPTMDVVCEAGNLALLDICEDYFSVAQNNINYAAALQRVYGWRFWGTAPGCGLI